MQDGCFARMVVWRCGQYRAGLSSMGTRWAIANPAGDNENDGMHVVFLQDRMCVDPVIQIAVVEGNHDRFVRHGLTGEKAGVLLQGE